MTGAIVAALFAVTTVETPPDLADFAQAGSRILGGHLGDAYATTYNQAGPVQLLLARLLLLGGSSGTPSVVVRLAVDLALVAAVAVACRRHRVARGVAWAVMALVVLCLGPSGLWSGHPVEILVPCLWAATGWAATRDRSVVAGVALGLSALIAPWGLLGAPVLLAGRLSTAARALGVGAIVTAAGYAPFVLSGRFAMFSHTWPVSPQSLVHLLFPHAHEVSWTLRMIQAAIVLAGTVAAVFVTRGTRFSVALPVLVTALLRVVTDPVWLDYYWLPVTTAAVAAAMIAGVGRSALAVVLVSYVSCLAPSVTDDAAWIAGLFGALAVGLLLTPRGTMRLRHAANGAPLRMAGVS